MCSKNILLGVEWFDDNSSYRNCIICNKKIENILCPNCLADSIKQWISIKKGQENYNELKKLGRYLNRYLEVHKKYEANSKKCINCNQYRTYASPCCLTHLLGKKLETLKINEETQEEFKKIFNVEAYDLPKLISSAG